MSDTPKLATEDLALINSAATGEGLIEVTPGLMQQMAESIRARQKEVAEEYPRLVAECPYETRLAITEQVFKAIVAHATEGGSFRYLIYDRLGFEADAYTPLYMAGGMTISNEFDLPHDNYAVLEKAAVTAEACAAEFGSAAAEIPDTFQAGCEASAKAIRGLK